MQAPPTNQALENNNELDSAAVRQALRVHSSHLGPTRINADEQKKWRIVLYSLSFIASLLFLSLLSALALPNALMPVDEQKWISGTSLQYCSTHLYLDNSTVRCYNSPDPYTTVGAYVTNLQALNQFLVLYLEIDRKYYQDKNLNINEQVKFALYNADRDTTSSDILVSSVIQEKTIPLSGKLKDVFPDGKLFILYMSKLSKEDEFYWQVTFQNGSQLSPANTALDSQIVNPNFSLFTILLRLGLFLVSLGVFLKFNHTMMKVPKDKVSLEQRFIQVLSAVTLTFNDQFYFITVIAPNPFSSFLSSFFLWNFVAFLFLIWSLFLNRIRKEEAEQSTLLFTIPRVVIILVFYSTVLSYTIAYAVVQTSEHPVFDYEDVSSHTLLGLEITAFIMFGLACTYIVYLFIRVLRDRPNRLYRHNVFLAFTLVFFISTVVFFFVGGYSLYDYSASKIFFTLTFMNMYSFYLQYLYAPTHRQLAAFKRDNKEGTPLTQLEDLIEIPETGEVEVVLVESENHSEEVRSVAQCIVEQSREEGSLSARERRRRRKRGEERSKGVGASDSRMVKEEEGEAGRWTSSRDSYVGAA